MHQPSYPESFNDATIKQWIQDYYTAVDVDGAVETIADFFTPDAVVQMGEHGVSDRPGTSGVHRSPKTQLICLR